MSRKSVIDLFCGAGGMSLGFRAAGFSIEAAADLDVPAIDTYRRNFPGVNVLELDLGSVSGIDITSNGQTDVIIGGPPCQGFSIGGTRNQYDARNEHILNFIRIVGEVRPRYFVMENVAGILSPKNAGILDSFMREAKDLGYSIVPIQKLNAVDFQVAQRRKRIFVLGYLNGEKPPKYPSAFKQQVTVRDAILDLQEIPDYEDLLIGNYIACEIKGQYATFLDLEFPPGTEHNISILSGCEKTHHSNETVDRFMNVKQGERDEISRFFRLHPDGQSVTLRAGTDKHRGKFTAPRPIHPVHPRCITVRESARLHSFPDWFEFSTQKYHAFRQIGNSVPPLLAKAIAREIYSCIN